MLEPSIWLLIGLGALAWGGDLLVKGAVGLALRLGVSAAVAGLTVVVMGTSAPELVVSLLAAMRGSADLAVANVAETFGIVTPPKLLASFATKFRSPAS